MFFWLRKHKLSISQTLISFRGWKKLPPCILLTTSANWKHSCGQFCGKFSAMSMRKSLSSPSITSAGRRSLLLVGLAQEPAVFARLFLGGKFLDVFLHIFARVILVFVLFQRLDQPLVSEHQLFLCGRIFRAVKQCL